jgi:predicted DNA-binding transcriptional regulator YafY
MTKRPDTHDTVLLALELLRRIPRTRKVSAAELHAQLQDMGLLRDVRTIQRQLEMLSEHFEIERDDRSKPYGYRWKERAKGLALPMLSEQESMLLMLAQQHLAQLLPASVMASMKGFFEQAQANLGLPPGQRQGTGPRPDAAPGNNAHHSLARQWLHKVRVVSTTQPLLPPPLVPGVLEAVSNALYANRWLNIEYQNAAGKRRSARIMPLGLAQQGPRLYLVCRFEGYDNERSLALHRFLAASDTGLGFERPSDFDLQRYDDDGRFGVGDGRRVCLSLTITQDAGLHLLESPLSLDQTVREVAGHYEITATVVDTDQLHRWLRSFGDQITRFSLQSVPTP